jgi:hypothetical protein
MHPTRQGKSYLYRFTRIIIPETEELFSRHEVVSEEFRDGYFELKVLLRVEYLSFWDYREGGIG